MTMPRPAAFLDRDGTIIVDAHFLAKPADVVIIPEAVAAIRTLNEADIPVVIITNQSGIARGLLSESDFARVQERVLALLADGGARIDATYHCPHHPDVGGACGCRKPGVELYRRAARDLALDVRRSFFAGDRWRDVEPAITLGGHGVLIPAPHTAPDDIALAREAASVAPALDQAVEQWLATVARP